MGAAAVVLQFLCLFLAGGAWPVRAADTSRAVSVVPIAVTAETIKAKISEIESTVGFEGDDGKRLRELYNASLGNLENASANEAIEAKLVESARTAPAEIARLKAVTASGNATSLDDRSEDKSLKDTEQELLEVKGRYVAVEAEISGLTRKLDAQKERLLAISQLQSKNRDNVSALTESTPSVEAKDTDMAEAWDWMRQTRQRALQTEASMLNREAAVLPLLQELANARRDEAMARLKWISGRTKRLGEIVQRKRQEEAARSMVKAQEAQSKVVDSVPALREMAAQNMQLSDELQHLTTLIAAADADKGKQQEELKQVVSDFNSMKKQVELAGMSQALGLLMHEKRRRIPEEQQLRNRIDHFEKSIATAALSNVRHAEALSRTDDTDALIAGAVTDLSAAAKGRIESELHAIVQNRHELLEKVVASNQSYLGVLEEQVVLAQQTLKTVLDVRKYAAEHLLWVRSTDVLGSGSLQTLAREVGYTLDPGRWLGLIPMLASDVPALSLLVAACVLSGLLAGWSGQLRSGLKRAAQDAANPRTYSLARALEAFGGTLLLASPWPLLVVALGWSVGLLENGTEFTRAVETGCVLLAMRFYFLMLLRQFFRPDGLAAVFLRWPQPPMALLRREIAWFAAVFLPVSTIARIEFHTTYQAGGGYVFGRLALLAVVLVTAVFLYRIFHPRSGVLGALLKRKTPDGSKRRHYIFAAIVAGLSVVLSALVLGGYIFAVAALLRCLVGSIWFVFALALSRQFIERCVIQSGRRAVILDSVSGRSTALQGTEPENVPHPGEEIETLGMVVNKLLNVLTVIGLALGMWAVWSEVLPALTIFNAVELWEYDSLVNGQPARIPVTLADGVLAALIGVVAMAATCHLPPLLDMTLYRQLNLSRGMRYTVTRITHYVLGGTGLLLVAGTLGFSWSKIQWLVAALGVGIGFGLQEIVANFISGIIILFERPIRVGDIVTIGETNGVVSRIQIRATTVRDFDGKELLVPNKEFISGRLLNWSLSDPVIRIQVAVGVAYGSDVGCAMKLMLQAAEENALVLPDPKPMVTFESFGDNCLNLHLRCFIGSAGDRWEANSGLNLSINHNFRDAGIEIAFPQRDVHLDTKKPLDIRMVGTGPASSGEDDGA